MLSVETGRTGPFSVICADGTHSKEGGKVQPRTLGAAGSSGDRKQLLLGSLILVAIMSEQAGTKKDHDRGVHAVFPSMLMKD